MEKSVMLGKIEGRRRSLLQSMRWLDCITDAVNINLGKSGRWWGTGRPGVLQFMGLQRVGHNWATKQQQPCTKAKQWQYKKTGTDVSPEQNCKSPQQNESRYNPTMYIENCIPWPSVIYSRYLSWLSIWNQPIYSMILTSKKTKNHMIISINVKKLTKSNIHFHKWKFNRLGKTETSTW